VGSEKDKEVEVDLVGGSADGRDKASGKAVGAGGRGGGRDTTSTLYPNTLVLYTLYSILYTLYSILYTLYSILYTLYSMLYTLYSILYTLYSILYTLYSILYTLYSIFYTPIRNTLYNLQKKTSTPYTKHHIVNPKLKIPYL
jgi:hypothetical protein